MPKVATEGQIFCEGRACPSEFDARYLRRGKLVATLLAPLEKADVRH